MSGKSITFNSKIKNLSGNNTNLLTVLIFAAVSVIVIYGFWASGGFTIERTFNANDHILGDWYFDGGGVALGHGTANGPVASFHNQATGEILQLIESNGNSVTLDGHTFEFVSYETHATGINDYSTITVRQIS